MLLGDQRASYGYFAFCIAAALVIAAGARGRAAGQASSGSESAVIGTVQAFALACGLLFVEPVRGFLNGTPPCCSAASSASPTARC